MEAFGEYPRSDVNVYDEIGREGERMLPFYRYMVIWKDLYTVFGGFVTWTYESLGIVSFTNELWSDDQPFGKAPEDGRTADHFFDDRLLMGACAFGLLIAIEWALSVTAFGRTSAQFAQAMFTPAGAIGLAGQVVFGLMPLLLRSRQTGRG